jgi:hypothetical protein
LFVITIYGMISQPNKTYLPSFSPTKIRKQQPTLMNWLTDWIFGSEAPAKPATSKPQPSKEDREARYVRDTLVFAKQQHKELRHKQGEQERWQQHYGSVHVNELAKLSGTEFEHYLAGLFKSQAIM